MKKQFLNVKDLIQNKVSPGTKNDKTDCVFPYMNDEEKHIENIKQTLLTTDKKISNLQESSKASEKRSKKYPITALGNAFENASTLLAESKPDSVLAVILKECSEHYKESAKILQDYEENVDRIVLEGFRKYTTEMLPALRQHKDKVHKDYSLLKNTEKKYETAFKAQQNSSTGPSTLSENKIENLKKELDECEYKHKQSRDIYEMAIMEFSCEEIKIAQIFSNYIQVQKTFYDEMQQKLQEFVPKLDRIVSESVQKPVFGQSLNQHLQVTKQKISLVFDFGIRILMNAKDEEGLFRGSGSTSKVKILRNALDCGRHWDVMKSHNLFHEFHVITGVIKCYLRELPESLLTNHLAADWLRTTESHLSEQDRLREMWAVIDKMPEEHKANLCFLIKFFQELSKNQQVNKMSSQNLAIAIGPSIFWTADPEKNIGMTNASPVIVEALINYCDYFFPEGKKPSLYYEEMKKSPPIDYYTESEASSSKSSSNHDNELSTKDNNNTNSSKINFSKFSSFRQKQNKSPTKDINPPPAPVLRSNVHSSPRFRTKSYYDGPSSDVQLIPQRPAPEVSNYRGSLFIPNHIPNHEAEKSISSLYPSLDIEVCDIPQQIPALSTFQKSSDPSNSDLASQPPQKPPRANSATPVQNYHQMQDSPVHHSTHL